MPQVETRARGAKSSTGRTGPPRVLIVLVVRDARGRLPQCLLSLSRQTYPRIGVLAVDDGSTDDSAELLAAALGKDRVIRLEPGAGFAVAVAEAFRSSIAHHADHLLVMDDHTLLAVDAIAGLVEAMERVEGVGVVGPKVLDPRDPRVLLDVGMSMDRFATPYSPLEEGEVDHGQYDRVREVGFVSSCAMLVSREALARVGTLDERFSDGQADLDFCWRVRLAGFRILVTPRSVVQHDPDAHDRQRTGGRPTRRAFERERGALASMLKNYSALSLLWLLPLFLAFGVFRIAWLVAGRRFEEAYQLIAAWGWNVVHLPGTIPRRVRAQRVRGVRDRSISRALAPAGLRLRGWALTAGQTLLLGREDEDREARAAVPSGRATRLVAAHPVATAWVLGAILAGVAYRDLLFTAPLYGGALGAVPEGPSGYFRELLSGVRTTGLGGTTAGSPALGILGIGSLAVLGNPAWLQKALLLGLPFAAAAGCYRAVLSAGTERVAALVAGTAYGLSPVVLWALSQGRIDALVFLAGMPWLAMKLPLAFRRDRPVARTRWVVGSALGVAILGSFFPGVLLAAGVVVLAALALPDTGRERGPGLLLLIAAAAVAMLLALPLVLEWLRAGGVALEDPTGEPFFPDLLRLSVGRGPGRWPTAWFLPVAAALTLAFVPSALSRVAWRAALVAVASIYLAWLSAAGYLPAAASNVPAYLGAAGFAYALLVGMGLTFLLREMRTASFGYAHLGGILVALLVATGTVTQGLQAAAGSWSVGGQDRLPAAYPLLQGPETAGYRILWVGAAGGHPFPAPGGSPDGQLEAGKASIRFAVRRPDGASALDVGRPAFGPGYDALRRALLDVLAGPARHGGALLAPFAIRYVVAEPGDLPLRVLRRFARQVDLDVVPAGGLIILQNEKAVPIASWVPDDEWERAAGASARVDALGLAPPGDVPLTGGRGRYRGTGGRVDGGMALLAEQYDDRWALSEADGGERRGRLAFGWAIRFPGVDGGSSFAIRFEGQRVRTLQLSLLALAWGVAVWMTRRAAGGA